MTENPRLCQICGDAIEDGQFVTPLPAYLAEYRGGTELVLDADNKTEVLIHTTCLSEDDDE